MVGRVKMAVSLASLVDKQEFFVHILNDLVELSSVFHKFGYLWKVLFAVTQQSLLEGSYVSSQLPDKFLDFGGSLRPIFCLKV